MRKLITFIFLVISYLCIAQPAVKIGDAIPEFQLNSVINNPAGTFGSMEMKDKIYIIEFWATWCGPCIPALDHLAELQSSFPDDLQVIAITSESESWVKRYPTNKHSHIWFTRDRDEKLFNLFNVSIVPHTVVVDKNGKIAAITSPENITASTISTLLASKTIDLPAKADSADIDYSIDYFNADPGTTFSIDLRRYRQGYPGYSKTEDEYFGERRITCINFTLDGLYRMAFGMSSSRTEYEAGKQQFAYKKENLYCFDLIVPEEKVEERYGIMQQYLNSFLHVNGRIENKEKQVYILKRKPGFDENKILAKDTATHMAFRGPEFNMTASPIDEFIKYLENELATPVVDDTNLPNSYDITFSYKLATPESFIKELNLLGLTIEKGIREIDVLVIYE